MQLNRGRGLHFCILLTRTLRHIGREVFVGDLVYPHKSMDAYDMFIAA